MKYKRKNIVKFGKTSQAINIENEEEGKNNQIEKLEKRKVQIATIFTNYTEKVEHLIQKYRFIPKNEKRKKVEDQVDAQLQDLVLSTGKNMYEKMGTDEEKVQILDRTITIRNMLYNFDEDFSYIEQMQNTEQMQNISQTQNISQMQYATQPQNTAKIAVTSKELTQIKKEYER